MKETFEVKNFADETLVTIAQAVEILGELSRYKLTLRQLYYQVSEFVEEFDPSEEE